MFRFRKKKSGWSYNTSALTNISILFGTAGTGDFVLDAPGGGTARFHYAHLGGAASRGAKWAKGSLILTSEDSTSVGDILTSETFCGGELSVSDFEGFALIKEMSGGVVLGASAR